MEFEYEKLIEDYRVHVMSSTCRKKVLLFHVWRTNKKFRTWIIYRVFLAMAAASEEILFLALETGERKWQSKVAKTELTFHNNAAEIISFPMNPKNNVDDVIKFHSHTHKVECCKNTFEEGVWRCVCEFYAISRSFSSILRLLLAVVFFLLFYLFEKSNFSRIKCKIWGD